MPIKTSGFHDNKEETSPFLFIKKGTTQVRILPAYNENGNWFKEVREISWQDENGKFKPLVSPSSNGDPCPFLEEGKRLYELGGEENVEASREFRPRSQFLFNVIVMNTPDGDVPINDCVKVLKCGTTVKRAILDLDQDHAGGWGDITNLENGVDIRITREGNGRNDTTYTVKGIPNRTNILEWLEERGFGGELAPHNLDEFFSPRSYEELLPLLEQKKAQMTNGQVEHELPEHSDVPIPQVKIETVVAPKLEG